MQSDSNTENQKHPYNWLTSFLYSQGRAIGYTTVSSSCTDSASILRFLAFQIRRDPTNLNRHIQRITLVKQKGQPLAIVGALYDLFIALGPKGKKLKTLMLAHCEPRIDESDYRSFLGFLDTGIHERHIWKHSSPHGSVLSAAYEGEAQYITPRNPDLRHRSDIQIAGEYLEYGQVHEAQAHLEEAYLRTPFDKEIESELLTIYRYTRDKTSFNTTTDQLILKQETLSKEWNAMAQELEQGN